MGRYELKNAHQTLKFNFSGDSLPLDLIVFI